LVTLRVGLRLAGENPARRRCGEYTRFGRILQPPVSEGMMIALDYVRDADGPRFVADNREAHGVRPVALRKARAGAAGIAEIAERAKAGVVGLPGAVAVSVANAGPMVPQREHRIVRLAAARFDGIEIGARHFGGIVAQGMSGTRLDALKNMVEQNPGDSFLRYGLAMEYRNSGDLEGALREFRSLIAANPDYSAAYFHGGQTLERMGRTEEARTLYETGVDVTRRKGEAHALSEMQAALDLLG